MDKKPVFGVDKQELEYAFDDMNKQLSNENLQPQSLNYRVIRRCTNNDFTSITMVVVLRGIIQTKTKPPQKG